MDGPVQSEASCSRFQVGTSSSFPEYRKRAHESACGDRDAESPAKRRRLQYYFVLESESELPTDEYTESEHSVQGRETDFVKDTSDTSSHSDSSALQLEYDEYEVASTSSGQPSFSSESMSSGTDDVIYTTGVITAVIDEDLGLFADTSDSDPDPVFDSELPRNDFWACVQCKNKNNNPLFRFCEKCYRLRKGFLPPRPRRRRSKKKTIPPSPPCSRDQSETDPKNSDNRSVEAANTLDNRSVEAASSLNNRSAEAARTLDNRSAETASAVGSRSAECAKNSDNRSAKSASDLTVDSGYQCSEPGSPQASTSQQLSESSEGPELCIICVEKPKNGIFVHSKIGHICCCYKCALKVWKKRSTCPLCSRKIKNVLQAFIR